MTPTHLHRRRTAGFTLIELMVVVVIIGLAAGVVSLMAGQTDEQRLDLAEIEIRDAFARAQSLAFSNRAPHAVVFDVDGERFTIVDEEGEPILDPLTQRPFLVDFFKPGQQLRVAFDAADFGAAGQAAIFDAQGDPLTGGTLTISRNGVTRVFTLDDATGQISTGT